MTSSVKEAPANACFLRIAGMDCGGCERKVEAAVARLPGVVSVSASAMTGRMSATWAPDATVNPEVLRQTIEALGYRVEPEPETLSGSHPAAPRWWQDGKARLVAACAVLLAMAALLHWQWPALGAWPFVAATLVGLVPIARSAARALRARNPFTIETLMTVAALGALFIGAAAEAAVVVFLFAVGEWLEGLAAARARHSISALARLTPATARRLEAGRVREIPAAHLMPGEHVQVRPGDRIPCDGVVITGAASVDESPVNGESVPRLRAPGDTVFAGTVALDATLEIEATTRAEDNTIARIIRLVEDAQAAKAPVARFIDRFAQRYMPAVVLLAVLMAVVPPLVSDLSWHDALYRALALLLIACPCALVISTPAAIAAGLSAGARHGLLIKGGAVLEQLGRLRLIAFDKTGTLTAGKPQVTDVHEWQAQTAEASTLALAAALEQGANHPIAQAIVQHAERAGTRTLQAEDARALPGRGVSGRVAGRELYLLAPHDATVTAALDAAQRTQVAELEAQGKSVAILLADGQALGCLAVRDEPREDAHAGLAALRRLGIQAVMLSGDNPHAVRAAGAALNIEAHGSLRPEDKAALIEQYRQEGRGPVGKVGDGINDAPALAAADVGIAMGGGTDVALETADAALLRNRVGGIAELVALSRATLFNVKANVVIALSLKAVFLISTALGFTGMWIAVMADTGATVLVTLNAMRLLGFRFQPTMRADSPPTAEVSPASHPGTA